MMPSPADIIITASKMFGMPKNSPISSSILLPNGIDFKKLQQNDQMEITNECSPSHSKLEPTSSSNSQPGTPRVLERRTVPACAICGTDSTGIHFGVDACAACSAFFRRTVVLNKEYGCSRDGNCVITKDSSGGQKCRACRFSKCIRVGMDRSAVQHRRDAIGKYSAGVKREYSPSPGDPQSMSPKSPKSSKDGGMSILDEFMECQKTLNERRNLFYAWSGMEAMVDANHPDHKTIRELTNIEECIWDLWRTEPRLATAFVKENKYLSNVNIKELTKIIKNFIVVRQAVEEPYLTWKHGGLEKEWWVMTNKVYIDCKNPEKYFLNGSMGGLNLDVTTAKNLFLPSFTHAMSSVGDLMRRIDISHVEMVSLLALLLLDPAIPNLTIDTRKLLSSLRDQVIKDLFNYYEGDISNEDPEVRLGNLIHAIRTHENMQMFSIFNLVPNNKTFSEMASWSNSSAPELFTNDEDHQGTSS
ncbi:hypothetical protein WR25_23150 [Diploscapter pachys]|uniref:Nuclear receptor domain-containing protein n=1 Tax=Diploscapter pachys TaxID=2018661 RepID=A0A2A2LZQ9_9BILA|nr:hypothetical protein WR25_23150 [Diploscapter pachys]